MPFPVYPLIAYFVLVNANALNRSIRFDNPIRGLNQWLFAVDGLDGTASGCQGRCLVARIKAIRLFLAYASFKDFVVYQMDVKSAFLYGKIEEEVYVCQPSRFEDLEFPSRVSKVEKALYGLHQAPRAWYETLSTYLLDNGFQRGQIDKTLNEMCTEFEKIMHKKFQMSSMGELTFFLGMQVTHKDDGIFISQDKYVNEILKKFGFSTVKTSSTPMETSKPLLKDAEAEDVDVDLYRSMIGSLMYLTASRPDIMFAVYACARLQVTPKVSHLHAVKRIFRYPKDSPFELEAYTDSDYADLEAYSDNDYAGASLDIKSTTLSSALHDLMLSCKNLTFADSHNMVAYLEKSKDNADFAEIVNFLNITTYEPVTTASAPVTTAGVSVSTAEPSTPPTTTTTPIEDEDLTIAQTLIKMKSEKSKAKRSNYARA
ncbi:putative ribonuclease H-like domain-containing protein [Tanacetum coccineum]